jgi:hypothetical protein
MAGVVRSHWLAVHIRRRVWQRPLETCSTVWAWLDDVPSCRHGLIVLGRLFPRVGCRLAGLPGGPVARQHRLAGLLYGQVAQQPRLDGLLGEQVGHQSCLARLLDSPVSLRYSTDICLVVGTVSLVGHTRVDFWTFPLICLATGPPGSWSVFIMHSNFFGTLFQVPT